MEPVTLYKRGLDPYTVDDQEALDYHLTQGWVTDPEDMAPEPEPAATPEPPPCAGCVSRDKLIAELEQKLALATVPKPTAPAPVSSPTISDEDRVEAIKVAVQAVPREKWQRASGGRPEMPLIADVQSITGFTVKSTEIIAVLKETV